MNIVSIDRRADKAVGSKENSVKKKFNEMFNELKETPFDGEVYKKLNGEHLFKEDFENVKVYSVKLADRLRMVYEYKKLNDEGIIVITDVANHEHRGKAYAKQYSE